MVVEKLSKHTTTLYEIIESELQRLGLNEFVNNDRIHFNDSKHSFMQKMLYFDDDVKQIVDHMFLKVSCLMMNALTDILKKVLHYVFIS